MPLFKFTVERLENESNFYKTNRYILQFYYDKDERGTQTHKRIGSVYG